VRVTTRDRWPDRWTGTTAAFAPARALYQWAGFVSRGPFAGYRPRNDNVFMTRELDMA